MAAQGHGGEKCEHSSREKLKKVSGAPQEQLQTTCLRCFRAKGVLQSMYPCMRRNQEMHRYMVWSVPNCTSPRSDPDIFFLARMGWHYGCLCSAIIFVCATQRAPSGGNTAPVQQNTPDVAARPCLCNRMRPMRPQHRACADNSVAP